LAKKPETVFKERLLKILKEENPGAWIHKTNELATRGIPDLFIMLNNKFYAYELKKDEFEDPDPLQTYTLEKIAKNGGVTGTLHPKNFKRVLIEHGILKEKIK
jgi:hypothetical protein